MHHLEAVALIAAKKTSTANIFVIARLIITQFFMQVIKKNFKKEGGGAS